MAAVLQTDYAWSEDSIERQVIEAAGHVLVSGPASPLPAREIEALVAQVAPVAIMTCWAEVSARAIGIPASLRVVQRIGVGLDNIALAAATARGAWVANVPDYCIGEVADHAVSMLLSWARGTVQLDREVKGGRWNPAALRLRRVSDLQVGIVGLGRIGRATAARLHAFGCTVLATDPSAQPCPFARLLPLEELVAASDAVVLHAPLTPETHHLFGASQMARMRRGAFLINVSRGPLIDNDALIAALDSGHLSGAGLDVVEGEPNPPASLLCRPDVIATPHVAFSSEASLIELRRRAAEEVVRVLAGEPPRYPCNQPAGLR